MQVENKTEKEVKILTVSLKETAASEKELAGLFNDNWHIVTATNLGDGQLALILERAVPPKKNDRIGFVANR